jgi:hypothetical protein
MGIGNIRVNTKSIQTIDCFWKVFSFSVIFGLAEYLRILFPDDFSDCS